MEFIKTSETVPPLELLRHPDCGEVAEWVGIDTVDEDEEIWRDIYWCPHCHKNFHNDAVSLWCDPATDNFYAYEVH